MPSPQLNTLATALPVAENLAFFNLSHFLTWLRLQMNSGDERFNLPAQNWVLAPAQAKHGSILFLRLEVLEKYSYYSEIELSIVQQGLKNAFGVNHSYSIESNSQIVEVVLCPLDPF